MQSKTHTRSEVNNYVMQSLNVSLNRLYMDSVYFVMESDHDFVLDLLTDDNSRVKLTQLPGVEGSDYINASFIDVSLADRIGQRGICMCVGMQKAKKSCPDSWNFVDCETLYLVTLAI